MHFGSRFEIGCPWGIGWETASLFLRRSHFEKMTGWLYGSSWKTALGCWSAMASQIGIGWASRSCWGFELRWEIAIGSEKQSGLD